ncbi:Uncharacterised protein [Pseudomonas aeruginosa]|nr:Uncharacterised protein [Pseudomonas aeruginosa]VTL96665.1 Uncharacterised protein [Pseudomonas aeruginosa]
MKEVLAYDGCRAMGVFAVADFFRIGAGARLVPMCYSGCANAAL